MQEVTGSSPVSPTNFFYLLTDTNKRNIGYHYFLNKIVVTFSDGFKRSFEKGITLVQAIKESYPENYRQVVAAKLNDQIVDLGTTVENDATVHNLTCSEPEGLQVFWHSASHIMAQAVRHLFPEVILGIGPSIANGFYYDFRLEQPISAEDFPLIENVLFNYQFNQKPNIQQNSKKYDTLQQSDILQQNHFYSPSKNNQSLSLNRNFIEVEYQRSFWMWDFTICCFKRFS